MAGPQPSVADAPDGFIAKFTVLRTAPRELWLTYWAKITEVAAYGLVNMGLMLYLIGNLGFSDEAAGTLIAAFAITISAVTFVVGGLSDAMGVRKTLVIAFSICLVTRTLTALLDDPLLVPVLGLMPMAVGVAMTIPVMVAATRRFTNKKQTSTAFSLLYTVMNIGFIVAGKLFDVVRNIVGKHGVVVLPGLGTELTVYEVIFLIAAGITVAGLAPLVLFMRSGVEMPQDSDEVVIDPKADAPSKAGPLQSVKDVLVKTGTILKEVVSEQAFWRFMLLLALVVGVRMIFYHMHYTLPVYADREIGFGSRFGTAWGVLNSAMIVVLAPLFGAIFQKVSSFKMIVIGTLLSALPCFFLVMPSGTFAGLVDTPLSELLKWFLTIDGDLSPVYFNLVFFAAIFSVGEAIWLPRLYEYTASVAPKGRESTYMGLSLFPLFVAKFAVGPLAGILLGRYCPAEGARNSGMLWLVVAIMAVATPIFVLLLRGIIQPKGRAEEGSDDGAKERTA